MLHKESIELWSSYTAAAYSKGLSTPGRRNTVAQSTTPSLLRLPQLCDLGQDRSGCRVLARDKLGPDLLVVVEHLICTSCNVRVVAVVARRNVNIRVHFLDGVRNHGELGIVPSGGTQQCLDNVLGHFL